MQRTRLHGTTGKASEARGCEGRTEQHGRIHGGHGYLRVVCSRAAVVPGWGGVPLGLAADGASRFPDVLPSEESLGDSSEDESDEENADNETEERE
jgi:hypothetical protein